MKKLICCVMVISMILCCLPESIFAQDYVSGSFTYKIMNGNAIIKSCDTKTEGNVIIPFEIDGCQVTAIDETAFMNCSLITLVSIPHSVTKVGYGAFSGCTNLRAVVFNNEYTLIEKVSEGATNLQVFAYCASLETIYGFANSTADVLAKELNVNFCPIARVELNGKTIEFDVPAQIINSRTMVPMRKIFESLGADVGWDGETKTVTAKLDETVVTMQIDNCTMSVNGEEILLDVPPIIINDRTIVPVRAASEGLGAIVEWHDITKTVSIQKENAPLTKEQMVSEFSDLVYTTNLTRMGDAFYNWSIDIPERIPLSILADDGTYFEFSYENMDEVVSLHVLKKENATIETLKQSELDYVYSGDATLISQTVEKTTDGVEYVRTVYEYDHYWSRFRGDSRMFLKDGYLYSLYTRCYANDETDIEYYKSIADSFSFSFDAATTEPLQKIENGYRWYSSSKYKIGFNVPADWNITTLDNQVVALSDSLDNAESIGMIGFSVFSVTEGETLAEYAQKNKNAYKELYETAGLAYAQSELAAIDIDENAGLYYTDEINLPDLKIYRKDIYFYLGEYVYNFQVQFKNQDASITDSIIDSFIAIELDKNVIGYIKPQPAG